MAELTILGTAFPVKDYFCAQCGSFFDALPEMRYIRKEKPALWLYVNVTDRCSAACPFCVSGASPLHSAAVDPGLLEQAVRLVLPNIYGVSFTGGEPMLCPELLDEAVCRVSELVPEDFEIDLATNGSNLPRLARLRCLDRLTSIHISRHSVDDLINRKLMNGPVPMAEELKEFLHGLTDPGKVVLNCVLQKGLVENCAQVAEYLDFAISIGVRNTSFITMFRCNDYCREHYVSPLLFPVVSDRDCERWNSAHPGARFQVWNRHCDHDFCRCLSGSYENGQGRTRFYFRCPGDSEGPSLCRQLVYTADNCLQDGFGKNRTVLWRG